MKRIPAALLAVVAACGGPAQPEKTPMAANLETATFGGGCFWCLEACYRDLAGVESAVSGYMGGSTERPDYKSVCSGATGHAEVVQVRFDPAKIAYAKLLEVFFTIHDPTTLNRQGADVGTQYRSVIFTHTPEQAAQAKAAIARLEAEKIWPDPVVTEVTPAPAFWKAEDYHQDYFRKNPEQGYCRAVVRPKVEKFRKVFKDLVPR